MSISVTANFWPGYLLKFCPRQSIGEIILFENGAVKDRLAFRFHLHSLLPPARSIVNHAVWRVPLRHSGLKAHSSSIFRRGGLFPLGPLRTGSGIEQA